MDSNLELKKSIEKILDSGQNLMVNWNCGGDEAIISVFIDDNRLAYDNPFGAQLELYLINYLNLPDVGGFSMEGQGFISKEEGKICINYESVMKGMEDFNTGEWKEMDEKEDMFSGAKKLFK